MADRLLADSGNPPPRVFRLLLSSPPSWVLHSVTINCRNNISSQVPRPTLLSSQSGNQTTIYPPGRSRRISFACWRCCQRTLIGSSANRGHGHGDGDGDDKHLNKVRHAHRFPHRLPLAKARACQLLFHSHLASQ